MIANQIRAFFPAYFPFTIIINFDIQMTLSSYDFFCGETEGIFQFLQYINFSVIHFHLIQSKIFMYKFEKCHALVTVKVTGDEVFFN